MEFLENRPFNNTDDNDVVYDTDKASEANHSKTGKRFELQRKIDEELRKLRLADGMEQLNGDEEYKSSDAVSSSDIVGASETQQSKKENDPIPSKRVIDEKVDADVQPSIEQNEETIQSSVQSEIDTPVDSKHGENNETQTNGVGAAACHSESNETGETPDTASQVQEAEPESAALSPSVTSPTTTTGTFTLPLQSPGIEEELGEELLPTDLKYPDAIRDPVEIAESSPGIDFTEASSEFRLGQNQARIEPILNKTAGTENDVAVQSGTGTSVDGPPFDETQSDIQSPCLPSTSETVATDLGTGQEMQAMEVNGDTTAAALLLNGVDVNDELAKAAPPALSSGDDDVEHRAVLLGNETVQTIETEGDCIKISEDATEKKSGSSEPGTKEVEDTAGQDSDDTFQEKQESTEHSQSVVEAVAVQDADKDSTVSPLHTQSPQAVTADLSALSSITGDTTTSVVNAQNTMDEHSDRKLSTDEDDYSGYDIDMGDPSSCQEEFSIAEEDILVDNDSADHIPRIQLACDKDNVPIFADVKYTVGEQIESQSDGSGGQTPTEGKPNQEYPEIVPWDSHGKLEEVESNAIRDDSFPSDKAESSMTGDGDRNEDFDEEASAKIAAETVSSAIKAAYQIACNNGNAECDNLGPGTKSTEEAAPDNALDETNDESNFSAHGVENLAPDSESPKPPRNATEANTEIQESANEISPSHLVGERENDVTLDDEKIAVQYSTVREDHTVKNAAESAGNVEIASVSVAPEKQAAVLNKEVYRGQPKEPVTEKTCDIGDEAVPAETSTETEQLNIVSDLESEEETMGKAADSDEKTRNFPERISYNPALSQRNTEATKWFGQPTSEDKIWMKPSGRVDENAEIERKKLIKAMTRRHNPNIAPKWQPPVEKDFTENLDDKQKKSLKRYEERRRSRSDAAMRSDYDPKITIDTTTEVDARIPPTTPELPKENIVIESVVHSRDAISAWESRLSEKHEKEELERQRLTKQKKKRERASSDVCRFRTDSTSSAGSSASTVLPTSEHIERDSMDVSKVRNRWKNIEEQSNKAKPLVAKKESSRRSNFSVKTAPAYRSYRSPTPAAKSPVNVTPINASRGGPTTKTPLQKESFIDREIREAAEREERWKHEQWEKMSEVSAASSEEVFPDNLPTPSSDPSVVATVYTRSIPPQDAIGFDIMKDASREESWKNEHEKIDAASARHQSKDSSGIGSDVTSPSSQRHENASNEADLESLSSYDSSGAGGSGLISPPLALQDKAKELSTKQRENLDSNIESVDMGVKSPGNVLATQTASDKDLVAEEEEARSRRQRIASLTNAVTPKGWEPSKSRAVGPVSPIGPMHRSVPKPEAKSPKPQHVNEKLAVKNESVPATAYPKPVLPAVDTEAKVADREPVISSSIDASAHSQAKVTVKTSPGKKKTGPVFQKKSGPVEVSSSKSRLQSVMEKEMQDASAREEEWRRKQLELVNQGIDISPHPVVHSTREIRTPTGSTPPPPVNAGQPQVQLRRPVKSLFVDDESGSSSAQLQDPTNEFGKRAVVKAMRVPKRRSQLAMMWEEGQFQNNATSENE